MNVRLVIDGSGTKYDAICGVFLEHLKPDEIIPLDRKYEGQVPMCFEDFERLIIDRISSINLQTVEDAYVATIQKGFYRENGRWYLQAVAAVRTPDKRVFLGRTSSALLPLEVSLEMDTNPENRNDALKKKFKQWDGKTPMIELLTEGVEREKEWFQAPLRDCVRNILR